MKRTFIEVTAILIVAGIAAILFNMASGNRINITKTHKKVKHVNQEYNIENIDIEIFRFYREKEGNIVLDARPDSDFRSGHIPGARSFSINNFETLFRERGELLKLGKTIIVYCSGPTCEDSHRLAQKLSEKGITDIFIFTGGMEEWVGAGFETEVNGI